MDYLSKTFSGPFANMLRDSAEVKETDQHSAVLASYNGLHARE